MMSASGRSRAMTAKARIVVEAGLGQKQRQSPRRRCGAGARASWSVPLRSGTEIHHPPEFGDALLEQLQQLALQIRAGVVRQPRDVPAGPRQTVDQPLLN